MHCHYSTRAERDLIEIGEFIAQQSPGNARSYVNQIMAHCRKVALNPEVRKPIAHIRGRPLRKALYKRHRIYYTVLADGSGIEVVHIRHGARLDPMFD